MPSRRRAVLSTAILGSALAGCPAFLSDDFRIAADATVDATAGEGEDATAAGDDGRIVDGAAAEAGLASDAQPSGCCTALGDPLDQATFDHWSPLGSATAFPSFVELTANKANQAGAVFWPAPASVTDFDVEFDFSITKTADSGGPGDGLAFVAMAATDAPCEAGGNLCLIGTSPGFGLVVRTFRSAKEPAVPYIAFVDTSRALEADAGPGILGDAAAHFEAGIATAASTALDPPDASWRTLCIRVMAGSATVKLDGQTILSGVPLTGASSAHWGLLAATGSATERNAVRQLRIIEATSCGGNASPCADGGLCGN
jgi:Bacterial lectin